MKVGCIMASRYCTFLRVLYSVLQTAHNLRLGLKNSLIGLTWKIIQRAPQTSKGVVPLSPHNNTIATRMKSPWLVRVSITNKEFKRGIGTLLDPCVNTMGRRPYCSSCMEVSYCTFRFGAIIQRDLRTLSLPRDSCAITNMRAWFELMQERQLTLN